LLNFPLVVSKGFQFKAFCVQKFLFDSFCIVTQQKA